MWLVRDRVFDTAAKANVMLHLAAHVDGDGGAWPSQERLAAETGLSRGWVQKTLDLLEADGVIRRSHRRRGGRWTSDSHQLVAEAIAALPLAADAAGAATMRAERARSLRAEPAQTTRADRAGSVHGEGDNGEANTYATRPPSPTAPSSSTADAERIASLAATVPSRFPGEVWHGLLRDLTSAVAARWRYPDARESALAALGVVLGVWVDEAGEGVHVAAHLAGAIRTTIHRVAGGHGRAPSYSGLVISERLAAEHGEGVSSWGIHRDVELDLADLFAWHTRQASTEEEA